MAPCKEEAQCHLAEKKEVELTPKNLMTFPMFESLSKLETLLVVPEMLPGVENSFKNNRIIRRSNRSFGMRLSFLKLLGVLNICCQNICLLVQI